MTVRGSWSWSMWMDRRNLEGKAGVAERPWGRGRIGLYVLALELAGLWGCFKAELCRAHRSVEDAAGWCLSGELAHEEWGGRACPSVGRGTKLPVQQLH